MDLNELFNCDIVAAFRGTRNDRSVLRLEERRERVERIYTWYKEFTAVTISMAQATLLGICSDTVVTILHPSSTIECFDGNNIVANNLIVEGLATFNNGLISTYGPFRFDASGNVDISGTLDVVDLATFNGGINSTGNVNINGTLNVDGSATFNDNVDISGTLGVDGRAAFSDNVDISGTLTTDGRATFKENVDISGTLTTDGRATFKENVDISGTLTTDGRATFKENVDISGTLTTDGRATFNGGLVSTTGPLLIDASGTVTSATDIISNSNTLVPPAGSIMMYAGTLAPLGWFMCDGGSYSQTTYARLFSVIGTVYGGSLTEFMVPDVRSRVPIGAGYGTGLTPYDLAQQGGVETVTLDTNQIPAHSHTATSTATVTDPGHAHGYDKPAGGTNSSVLGTQTIGSAASTTDIATTDITVAVATTTDDTGSGQSHTNIQPYLALNYIIKW